MVALVLAADSADDRLSLPGFKSKALLPIGGRPMVDYVLEALQSADVERIFVTQTRTTALDEALAFNGSTLFVTCPADHPTLTESLICGAESIFDYYGKDELSRRLVMLVPCDIPFVLAEDFNYLIHQCSRQDADIFYTIIQSRRLKSVYPDRSFHSQYLKDMGDVYTVQCPVVVSGEHIDFETSGSGTRRFVLRDRDNREVTWVVELVEEFRRRRHGLVRRISWTAYKVAQTGWFLRQLVLRGHVRVVLRVANAVLRHRLTTRDVQRAHFLALSVKFALLESSTPEFSADIDSQRDLEETRSAIGAR